MLSTVIQQSSTCLILWILCTSLDKSDKKKKKVLSHLYPNLTFQQPNQSSFLSFKAFGKRKHGEINLELFPTYLCWNFPRAKFRNPRSCDMGIIAIQFCFCFVSVPKIKPWALQMLAKCSAPKLGTLPAFITYCLQQKASNTGWFMCSGYAETGAPHKQQVWDSPGLPWTETWDASPSCPAMLEEVFIPNVVWPFIQE